MGETVYTSWRRSLLIEEALIDVPTGEGYYPDIAGLPIEEFRLVRSYLLDSETLDFDPNNEFVFLLLILESEGR